MTGTNIDGRGRSGEAGAAGRAAVVQRHREEWERLRVLVDEALNGDPEAVRLAKTAAEILKIRQEGERRAWGIQDRAETEPCDGLEILWRE